MLPVDIETLLKRFGGRCFYCRIEVVRHKPKHPPLPHNYATRDHVVPRRARVAGDGHRIVLACHACNTRKADQFAQDFLASDWLTCRRALVGVSLPTTPSTVILPSRSSPAPSQESPR